MFEIRGELQKSKAEHLYSALHGIQTTLKRSGMNHSLTFKGHMPQMPAFMSSAYIRWRQHLLIRRTSNCSLLMIFRPQEDERLSWPGWLTSSGRFTHISSHTSAEGRNIAASDLYSEILDCTMFATPRSEIMPDTPLELLR